MKVRSTIFSMMQQPNRETCSYQEIRRQQSLYSRRICRFTERCKTKRRSPQLFSDYRSTWLRLDIRQRLGKLSIYGKTEGWFYRKGNDKIPLYPQQLLIISVAFNLAMIQTDLPLVSSEVSVYQTTPSIFPPWPKASSSADSRCNTSSLMPVTWAMWRRLTS